MDQLHFTETDGADETLKKVGRLTLWHTAFNLGICNLEWSDLKFQSSWVCFLVLHSTCLWLVIATSYYSYIIFWSCLCDYLSQFRGTIGAIGYNKAGGHCPQTCCTGEDDDSPSFWHRAVRQHLVSSGWRCFFSTSQACEFAIFNDTECHEKSVWHELFIQ